MKFTIIRFLKSLFIRLHLHILFRPFEKFLLNIVYMSRLSTWVSEHKKISYNDFYSKWNYEKRYELYKYVFEREDLKGPINYLEFGVANGVSFNWWMERNTHPASAFYGFDTFTGLPEDFGPYKKGTFNTSNNIPATRDLRGKFYQGLFQQTLPPFLKTFDTKNKNVIMLDADLYTATLYAITSLAPYLKNGDIIFFDEFVVPTHEFMAYQNFIDAYHLSMELIAAANNYYFVAFKVT